MDAAGSRCAYADARWVGRTRESASVVDGAIEAIAVSDEEGVGVRVRVDGAWGFAATQDASPAGLQGALQRALALAEAQPRRPGAAPLAPLDPARGSWEGPCAVDPFGVSLEEKLDLLLAADEAMAGDARIARRRATTVAERTVKAFASTDGAACEQAYTECGGGIVAVAVQGGELQVRSYPSAHAGDVAQAGWEHVRALDLAGNGARVADEAVALLHAPVCPAGPTPPVLGSQPGAPQPPQAIGPAPEPDPKPGSPAADARPGRVAAADARPLRYGSEALNVVADATLPGGLGTYGWDDEGVPGRRFGLVEGGRLVATLSSRETAGATGLGASGGAMRADGFARQPLVRMTNVSLEPGDGGGL